MPRSELIAQHQRELNRWTDRYLRGVHPLEVDGVKGRATNSRTMAVKWYLGYGKRDAGWRSSFVRKLRNPHSPRFSPPWQLALGAKRRATQRRHWAAGQRPKDGLVSYDGHMVAAWMVPQLDYARHTGTNGVRWHGVVISAYRTPAYSRSLCIAQCGRPSCPGTCAGVSSRHSQYRKPDGAVDLSNPEEFDEAIRGCPETPRLINRLPNDRPHHSSSGN